MKKKIFIWGIIILILLLLIGITWVIYRQTLKNEKGNYYVFSDINEVDDFLNDINNLNYDWDTSSVVLMLNDFNVNNQVSDVKLILNRDINNDGTFYFSLYVNDNFVPTTYNSKLMALNVELKNNMLMFIGNTGAQNSNINLYLVDFSGNILLDEYDIFYQFNNDLLIVTDPVNNMTIDCMNDDYDDDTIVNEIRTYRIGYNTINLFNTDSITYGEYCENR